MSSFNILKGDVRLPERVPPLPRYRRLIFFRKVLLGYQSSKVVFDMLVQDVERCVVFARTIVDVCRVGGVDGSTATSFERSFKLAISVREEGLYFVFHYRR
jgi:hypothetical protein